MTQNIRIGNLKVNCHGEIMGHNIAYLQDLAAGRKPQVVEPLTDFYRETHGANILFVHDARQNLKLS